MGSHQNFQGYWMRSYAETMWASLMDAAGISWLYEPSLFSVGEGWYLPDFYLPAIDAYLEIKGPMPTPDEIQKAAYVNEKTGRPVLIAWGQVRLNGVSLAGGEVMVIACQRRARITLHKLSMLIKYGMSEADFLRLVKAGAGRPLEPAVSAMHALEVWSLSQLERSEAERDRARNNGHFNALKEGHHRACSKAEAAIAAYLSGLSHG